jgi:hypothetical protein
MSAPRLAGDNIPNIAKTATKSNPKNLQSVNKQLNFCLSYQGLPEPLRISAFLSQQALLEVLGVVVV